MFAFDSAVVSPRPIFIISPTTVSPTWKVPDVIVISRSLGTQYSVISTPSKNPYILVSGFIFLETNSTFLDLIYGIRSLLTTLSPTDSISNCSVTIVLTPDLERVPNSLVVLSCSSITWSVTVLVDVLLPGLHVSPW